MELLKSNKVTLPKLYFITDREEIKNLPIGVPFIYGAKKNKKHIIRMLEYEVIWESAKKSGFPFNFKKLLREAGFKDLKNFNWEHPVKMEFTTDENIDINELIKDNEDVEINDNKKTLEYEDENELLFHQYIEDATCYVDIQSLKSLKVFPIWMDDIEKAVHTNLHNFAIFNPIMYNKKLEGTYGSIELTSPSKNLFIFDISASVPKAIGVAFLILSKWLAETFYADILITGKESVLFEYENLEELDIDTAYDLYGNGNECKMFRKLISSDERHYKTIIVTGDNHSPLDDWSLVTNETPRLSKKDGQKLCKWTVDTVISFHTENNTQLAGYADVFTPKKIQHIKNWVKYLDDSL